MTDTPQPGLLHAPKGTTLDGLRIIHLKGADTPQRYTRISRADIAIDCHGKVVKDRYGYANRQATEAELKLAVDG
jgi:hypothetical protein